MGRAVTPANQFGKHGGGVWSRNCHGVKQAVMRMTRKQLSERLASAVRYAFQPAELATAVANNTRLTQIDDTVISMTVAYAAV